MIYPAEGELDPNSEDFHDIVRMSRSIGRNSAFVQGGGGNVSIKLDHRLMLIKASGVFLKNVETSSGLSLVDYSSLKDYIAFGCQQSCDEFDKALRKFELVPYGANEPVKCSIETGLHALLGKAVIHSHSVYSNILTCSNEGRDLVKKLFSNAIWVEYFTPGGDLAVAVARAIEDIDTRNSILIFLENHGILVSSATASECLEYHARINQEITNALPGLLKFKPEKFLSRPTNLSQMVIFPDQLVYAADGPLSGTPAYHETLAAWKYIVSSIEFLGWRPKTLTNEQVSAVLSLESEKYRQNKVL